MDSCSLLDFISPYLSTRDLTTVASLDRQALEGSWLSRRAFHETQLVPRLVEGFRREIACKILTVFWKSLLQRRWIDRVAASLPRLHAFPHRLLTNLTPLSSAFRGGVDAVSRIRSTKHFLPRRRDLCQCPVCHTYPVRSAVYQQIGQKMAQSTPYLFFGCGACCDDYASDPYHWEDMQLRWTIPDDEFWCNSAPVLDGVFHD